MTDCTHVFSPCSGECTSPTQRRAAEINAPAQDELAKLNRLGLIHAICAGFIVGIITLVALIVAVEAAKAGAVNISNTIQANKEP